MAKAGIKITPEPLQFSIIPLVFFLLYIAHLQRIMSESLFRLLCTFFPSKTYLNSLWIPIKDIKSFPAGTLKMEIKFQLMFILLPAE